MAIRSSENLEDEPGEFQDGHVLRETMVIDPVRAVLSIVGDGGIF